MSDSSGDVVLDATLNLEPAEDDLEAFEQAIRTAARRMERHFERVEGSVDEVGSALRSASASIGALGRSLRPGNVTERALLRLNDQMEKIRRQVILREGRSLLGLRPGATNRLVASLGQVNANVIDIIRSFERLADQRRVFDRLSVSARSASRRIGNDYERVGDVIRQSLGAALVRAEGGLERLQSAGALSADRIRAEFLVASAAIEDSLQRVVDSNILRELGVDAELVADDVDELRRAMERAAQEVKQLALESDGLDDFRRRVVRLEGELSGGLEQSLREIQRRLSLLRGDSSAFEEIREEARLAALETARLASETDRLGVEADQTRQSFRGLGATIERQATRGRSSIGTLTLAMSRLRLFLFDIRALFAVGLLGAGATEFVRFGVEATSSFDLIRRSLNAFVADVSSAEEAPGIINQIIESTERIAARTPFEFEDLAEGTRRLLAFADSTGRAGLNIQETFRIAQDDILTVSGLLSVLGQGSDALRPLIKAIGDVGARGRITGEEIRQFTNALPGFDVFSAISDELGLATDEFIELNSAGLIPAAESLDAFFRAARNFPGASSALAAQAASISGRFETLRDEIRFALAGGQDAVGSFFGFALAGEQFRTSVPDIIRRLLPELENLSDAFGELGAFAIPVATDEAIRFTDAFSEILSQESSRLAFEVAAEALGDLLQVLLPLATVASEFTIAIEPLLDGLTGLAEIGVSVTESFSQVPGLFDAVAQVLSVLAVRAAAIRVATFFGISTSLSSIAFSVPGIEAAAAGLRRLGRAVGPLIAAQGVLAGFNAITERGIDEGFFERAFGELNPTIRAANIEFEFEGDPQATLTDAINEQLRAFEAARDQINERFSIGPDPVGSERFGRLSTAGSAFFGQFIPGVTTASESAVRAQGELNFQIEQLQATLNDRVNPAIEALSEELLGVSGVSSLTSEEVQAFARSLGIDLTEGSELSLERLRALAQQAGGLVELIAANRSLFDDLTFSFSATLGLDGVEQARADLEVLAGQFSNLEAAIEGVRTAQIAAFDSEFAFLDALDERFAAVGAFQDVERGEEETEAEFRRRVDTIAREAALAAAEVTATATQIFEDALGDGGSLESALSAIDFFELAELDAGLADNIRTQLEEIVPDLVQEFDRIVDSQAGSIEFDPTEFLQIGSEGQRGQIEEELGTALVKSMFESIQNAFERLTPGFSVGGLVESIQGRFQDAVSRLESDPELAAAVQDALESFGGSLSEGTESELSDRLPDALSAGTVEGLARSIGHISSLFTMAGQQVGAAFDQGIRSGIGSAPETSEGARQLVERAREAARRQGLIESPSRLFAEIGRQFDLGLAKGILDNLGPVSDASRELVDTALPNRSPFASRDTDSVLPGGRSTTFNTPTTINVQQQPGESGELLADRIVEKVIR